MSESGILALHVAGENLPTGRTGFSTNFFSSHRGGRSSQRDLSKKLLAISFSLALRYFQLNSLTSFQIPRRLRENLLSFQQCFLGARFSLLQRFPRGQPCKQGASVAFYEEYVRRPTTTNSIQRPFFVLVHKLIGVIYMSYSLNASEFLADLALPLATLSLESTAGDHFAWSLLAGGMIPVERRELERQ